MYSFKSLFIVILSTLLWLPPGGSQTLQAEEDKKEGPTRYVIGRDGGGKLIYVEGPEPLPEWKPAPIQGTFIVQLQIQVKNQETVIERQKYALQVARLVAKEKAFQYKEQYASKAAANIAHMKAETAVKQQTAKLLKNNPFNEVVAKLENDSKNVVVERAELKNKILLKLKRTNSAYKKAAKEADELRTKIKLYKQRGFRGPELGKMATELLAKTSVVSKFEIKALENNKKYQESVKESKRLFAKLKELRVKIQEFVKADPTRKVLVADQNSKKAVLDQELQKLAVAKNNVNRAAAVYNKERRQLALDQKKLRRLKFALVAAIQAAQQQEQ